MLRDASLMIIYMETSTVTEHPDELMMKKINAMMDHLGILTLAFMAHDMVLLDNQIALVVVKVLNLLMDLRYGEGREGEGQYEKLLNRFINMVIFGEYRQQIVLSRKPMHLLEAIHMVVVFGGEDESGAAPTPTCCKLLCCPRADLESGATTHGIIHRLLKSLACKTQGAAKNDYNSFINSIHSFRSVTELKAKGIHFRPGPTSLMDVSFKSNFFYSTLHLREWILTPNTKVLFKNLVAYELSPGSPANREVTSYYITFMKSLIDRPEDVKELREKKIFINKLGSDQEVFNIYKDINTHGADNPMIFHAVKDKIQEHYNSNIKTWMAELIHNYFRSPWTMTAFLAAAALLAISFYHLVNFN
ncbi:uncharacterized protein LOC131017342 [Salvia miltiorrhiza]|uniref:uncharacterized protein LOC131017342 n=1 Tax=Salvia miltiorrhiza TaxID=226208 RepID=UPI0025ABB6CD|nr:uncharacterized protein LOC131017342 [Salvia miltiorrhiza]